MDIVCNIFIRFVCGWMLPFSRNKFAWALKLFPYLPISNLGVCIFKWPSKTDEIWTQTNVYTFQIRPWVLRFLLHLGTLGVCVLMLLLDCVFTVLYGRWGHCYVGALLCDWALIAARWYLFTDCVFTSLHVKNGQHMGCVWIHFAKWNACGRRPSFCSPFNWQIVGRVSRIDFVLKHIFTLVLATLRLIRSMECYYRPTDAKIPSDHWRVPTPY
jgi:hypothetical protein